MPNGDRSTREDARRNSAERGNRSPETRKIESPTRKPSVRERGPRTPTEEPKARPPSHDSNRRQPASPDRNMGNRTPSPERRMPSNERLGRPKREYSPCLTRYPTPPNDRRVRPTRPRTPLSPGRVYTDKQDSTEENGVFIDKVNLNKSIIA